MWYLIKGFSKIKVDRGGAPIGAGGEGVMTPPPLFEAKGDGGT